MTFADITLAVFTFRNSVRLVGYIPQIAKAVRDQIGAEDIAIGTWGATFKRAVGWVGLVCAPLFILVFLAVPPVGPYIGSVLISNVILILTLLSVFAGSLAAGLAGFAFSAISGAMLFHWLAPVQVVPLLLACSITTQLLSITKLWGTMRWRQCTPYLIGGCVGIPVGVKLLQYFSAYAFAAGFGILLVCYSGFMLLRPRFTIQSGGRLVEVAAGFAGGVTGGATAFPGAIPTILCNVRGLSKTEQRGVVQPFIFLMQIATLIYFSKLGILGSVTLTTYFWCLPAVVAGTWLGLRLFDRIDDTRFRRVVLIFLLISGVALVL
jgi:uncharacterized membrane protein YfcA